MEISDVAHGGSKYDTKKCFVVLLLVVWNKMKSFKFSIHLTSEFEGASFQLVQGSYFLHIYMSYYK